MLRSLLRPAVRTGAARFWGRILKTVLASIAFAVFVGLVTGVLLVMVGANRETQDFAIVVSSALVTLQAVYSQLSLTAERCRAVGRSSWWSLVLLIPVVGPLWLLSDLTFRSQERQHPAS